MAINPIECDNPAVTISEALPPALTVAEVMRHHSRDSLAAFVAVAIDLIDSFDGDADVEDDDPSGQYNEDEYTGPAPKGDGAGCPLSDNDFCSAGDDGCGAIYRDGILRWGSVHEECEIEAWNQPAETLNPDSANAKTVSN